MLKVLLTLSILSSVSYANDCKELSKQNSDNATVMRPAVSNYIKKLEQLEREAGREFTVGIIERSGTDLKDLTLLKVTDNQGRPTDFQTFMSLITYNPNGSDNALMQIYRPDLIKRIDKRKIIYSHVGFVLKNHPARDPETLEEGDWQLVHLLDPCERTGGPNLKDQTLDNFFRDELETYTYKILIPTPEIQQRLEKLILGDNYSKNSMFLSRVYNAATLWSQDKDGNSNSWPLEVIAAAQRPDGEVKTRAQAIRVLKETGYQPSVVLGTGKSHMATVGWIGDMFRVNFKDQPSAGQFNIGQIVTALSIEDYLKRLNQLVGEHENKITFLLPDKKK